MQHAKCDAGPPEAVQVGATCAKATSLALACTQEEAGLVSDEVPSQRGVISACGW